MRQSRFLLLPACIVLLAACSPPAPQEAHSPPAEAAPSAAAVVEAAPATATATATVEDWTLPGTLGPTTTRAELEARFGKANLREETRTGPEGEGEYAVLVAFPDDPQRRLELVLGEGRQTLDRIEVSGAHSRWHEASGLRVGMPLAELVALNGKPVGFLGLDWDYGGTVEDWHGGTLANDGATLFRSVMLEAREGVGDDVALPTGDGSFRSDDPQWPSIGKDLVVGKIGLGWPDGGDGN